MNDHREAYQRRIRRPLARFQNNRTDWFRFQNKAGETPKLYIYDEIGYWGDSAKDLVKQLQAVEGTELDVHLNSPGGEIFDGLTIYQALKDHPASVTVRIDGLAASIASVIAMAGDKIVMAPKASMMIHDGWTMAVGNAADLRETADQLDKQSAIIASVYADRTGQPADFWRGQMAKDTWFDAQEALDAGLVDEVEGLEKKVVDDPFDLGVFAHAGRDKAPAPLTKPPVSKTEESPVAKTVEPPADPTPAAGDPKKDEPAPFTWDFAAFRQALQEGVK